MTHTPGPWITGGYGRGAFEDEVYIESEISADQDDWGHALICETGGNAANARLIAAAPELLAALKAHMPWQAEPPQGWGSWQDAADAIAKAEGREA